MTFRSVETKTGNQVFSASVTQTASASAHTYPKALSLASKLAAELTLDQGSNLLREHLSNKSNKSKQSNKDTTCTITDEFYMCPNTEVQYTSVDSEDNTVVLFTYFVGYCTFHDSCYPTTITQQDCTFCGDSTYNTSTQLTTCRENVPNDCKDSFCGIAARNVGESWCPCDGSCPY